MRDIQIVKMDALSHPNDSVRKLSLRIIALTVSEFDMTKVTGKEFNDSLGDINCPQALKDEVSESLRAVRKAQKKAQKRLKELRINVIAHRDQDSLKQYELIEKIDDQLVLNAGLEFSEAGSAFFKALTRCVEISSNTASLVKQIARNIDNSP